jgi:hypothetical protein
MLPPSVRVLMSLIGTGVAPTRGDETTSSATDQQKYFTSTPPSPRDAPDSSLKRVLLIVQTTFTGKVDHLEALSRGDL